VKCEKDYENPIPNTYNKNQKYFKYFMGSVLNIKQQCDEANAGFHMRSKRRSSTLCLDRVISDLYKRFF
jgi:hypothetical protein